MPLLTDTEISALISEKKPLPENYQAMLQTRPKRGHSEKEIEISGTDGSIFTILLRQNIINPLDFSAILAYNIPKTNVLFRLCRYNGKSHEHTNKIEQEKFYTFHIHQATERYQLLGLREDSFAVPTDRYAELQQAIRCLIEDCNFILPINSQLSWV